MDISELLRVAKEKESEYIDSTWCLISGGITLSFAIAVDVMDVDGIADFGKQFEKAVKKSWSSLLKRCGFEPKTGSPLLSPTNLGELVMIWAFSCEDTDQNRKEMRESGIREISYE